MQNPFSIAEGILNQLQKRIAFYSYFIIKITGIREKTEEFLYLLHCLSEKYFTLIPNIFQFKKNIPDDTMITDKEREEYEPCLNMFLS